MMRFASLGSGSRGNALLIESGEEGASTRILLDCGLSMKHILMRLNVLAICPTALDAILISHEHQDHIKSAAALSRRFGIPVWMSPGTRLACGAVMPEEQLNEFDPHRRFSIDGLEVTPIPVMHDAREPVQFRISDGLRSLVHLTDLGQITPYVVDMSEKCEALIIECNHDLQLLQSGRYPAWLKKRIAGQYGHLSNDMAEAFVASLDVDRLRHIVAAHLSEENNRPDLARMALSRALNTTEDWVIVADQKKGTDWLVV